MSNREAAAAITAEREALIDLAHALSYAAYSWGFEAGKVGQHVDTTIAGNKAADALNTLSARLSAPVAAQPADSARLAALEAAVQQLCREFGAPQTARVQAAMDRALTAASKERSKT